MNNKDSKKIVELGGNIVQRKGKMGVLFEDPPKAETIPLFIPLEDFGYTEKHGIFRKSLMPKLKSEMNL